MTLKPAPEPLVLIRHRMSRTNEVWTAYQVFWEREVNIGPGFACQSEEKAINVTHTLLVAYLSYLYSMFDDSACHFIKDTEAIISDLTPLAIRARENIIEIWGILANPLKRLRHNTGFHGGKSITSLVDGYKQIYEQNINLALPENLMLFIDAFFRELEFIYKFEEYYLTPKPREYPQEIFDLAISMKESILERNFGKDINPVVNNLK